MSLEIGQSVVLVPTTMGIASVKSTLLIDYDIEDLVRSRAISQARVLQMINLGKEINPNENMPTGIIPSSFVGNTEEL